MCVCVEEFKLILCSRLVRQVCQSDFIFLIETSFLKFARSRDISEAENYDILNKTSKEFRC